MKSGLNKLFWGIVLISIHLNLSSLKIFPPFIGWIVILFGLLNLEKDKIWEGSTVIKTTVWIMIVLSVLEEIFVFTSSASIASFIPLLFYPIISIMIELIFFHHMFERFVNYFIEIDLQDNADKYIRKDRTYIILTGISLGFLILSLSIDYGLIFIIGSIMMLVTRVYLLVVFHSLRKEQVFNFTESISYVNGQ